MFIDETIIKVRAGDGGNGCYSHLREKYRPKGGPDGGNGGRGGHIYIEASVNAHTLVDVSYHKSYKGDRGAHGKGCNKTGGNGEDIVIIVPMGTVVIDDETGDILCDCVEAGKKILVATGGRGGKGNSAMKSRNNPNPDSAETGFPGQERKLRMELKVLADVGLVGRPNAGKSTFLSIISKAHPKIADYPFTTTEPHLGITSVDDPYESFVVADIPGLIEGSHEGKGLGIRFLKHIERTRVLAIMVEATAEDPKKEAQILINELKAYSTLLAEKPKFFILSKTDVLEKPKRLKGWMSLSSVSNPGVTEILREMKKMILEAKKEELG